MPVILDLAYKAVQRLKGLPRFNCSKCAQKGKPIGEVCSDMPAAQG